MKYGFFCYLCQMFTEDKGKDKEGNQRAQTKKRKGLHRFQGYFAE